ncbi:hypothetical protein RND81_02G014600 [Saponaria officinalis]|uniref:S5 DRBM domain-containing protein n=1 Tax=Saponaria officinalis TaxID=3572 RepID=A0AAW1MRC6_SAPOF
MNKSKLPISWLSHLILRTKTLNPKSPNLNNHRLLHNSSNPLKFNRISPKPTNYFTQKRQYIGFTEEEEDRALQELTAEIEREERIEREAKRKAGILVDDAEEEEEDYLGVGPLIEKIDNEVNKPYSILDKLSDLDFLDEPTDSDSEDDEEEDPVLMEEERKAELVFDRLCKRHQELLSSFKTSSTLDEAHNIMTKINRFEEKHFRLLPEYRVIGDLMTRFKDSTGKEKFLLAQKLNRAMRLVEYREEFNPNDSANYGVIQREEDAGGEIADNDDLGERPMIEGAVDDDEEEFDDMKGRDDILLEKVNEIDKLLEQKLAALDYTFGKKGKVLEEEIRDLAEERNALTEKKKRPLYRKGFDVQLIDVNRTCKVTKGGQVVKYTAILACGNYNGVVGYAKAKGPAIPIALQKAYEKCFQNLHYIDRYEDHTIAHAVHTTFKKTKVYLWPARTTTGMKAGKTVQTILHLAGFKNVKSKVIGSRNAHNTVKAVFQALNAIETPKDVQEKFGRTVVESYLL